MVTSVTREKVRDFAWFFVSWLSPMIAYIACLVSRIVMIRSRRWILGSACDILEAAAKTKAF
jgi:hypothetical protein